MKKESHSPNDGSTGRSNAEHEIPTTNSNQKMVRGNSPEASVVIGTALRRARTLKNAMDIADARIRESDADATIIFRYTNFINYAKYSNELLEYLYEHAVTILAISQREINSNELSDYLLNEYGHTFLFQIKYWDINKFPNPDKILPMDQKIIWDDIYTNILFLISELENEMSTEINSTIHLGNFISSTLRSSIFNPPDKEKEIQDVIAILLHGKGLKKGIDYDREIGRIKFSAKESVPDFVIKQGNLAVEVKLLKENSQKSKVIDEITADITIYSKNYDNILIVVYDVGGVIRDENEFLQDIAGPNVHVIVIKH